MLLGSIWESATSFSMDYNYHGEFTNFILKGITIFEVRDVKDFDKHQYFSK